MKRSYYRISTPSKRPKVTASPAVKSWVKKHTLTLESKNIDNVYSSTFPTTGAYIRTLNGVGQGNTGVTRNGRQIRVKKISLHLNWTTPTVTTRGYAYRIMILKDVECRGSQAANSDILENVSTTQNEIISPVNMSNFVTDKRFHAYYDKVHTLNPQIGSGSMTKELDLEIPCDFTAKYYDTSTGGVGDIDAGAIYLFLVELNDGTNAGSFNAYTRVTFQDN